MGDRTLVTVLFVLLLVIGIPLAVFVGSPAGVFLIFAAAVGFPAFLIWIAVRGDEPPPTPVKLKPKAPADAGSRPVPAVAVRQPRAVASRINVVGIEPQDYEEAWTLISGWRDQGARQSRLDALRASDRRPYVVIGMIRIAAMLANGASTPESLTGKLSVNVYSLLAEAILGVTDQIMSGLDEDDLKLTEEILPAFLESLDREREAAGLT